MGAIHLYLQKKTHPHTCFTPSTYTYYLVIKVGAGVKCETGVGVIFFVGIGGLRPLRNRRKNV